MNFTIPKLLAKTFASSASPGKVYHVFLVEEGAVSILLVAVVMFLFYLLPWGSIYLNQIMCLRICFWIHPPSSMQSGLRNPNQRNPSFLTIAYWVGGRLIDAKYVLSWEVLSTVNFFVGGHEVDMFGSVPVTVLLVLVLLNLLWLKTYVGTLRCAKM